MISMRLLTWTDIFFVDIIFVLLQSVTVSMGCGVQKGINVQKQLRAESQGHSFSSWISI